MEYSREFIERSLPTNKGTTIFGYITTSLRGSSGRLE
jgi:hypothetical protein